LSEEKRKKMAELVAKRRTGWLPENCYRLGDAALNNGYWDEDEFVVPWSKSACNYDAKLMLMAQDWDSYDNLSVPLTDKHRQIKLVGRNVDLPTNKRIDELLHRHFGMSFSDTFATDLFPFVKPGDMRGKLQRLDVLKCAGEFAVPQIEIIEPLIVICLGRSSSFKEIAYHLTKRLFQADGDRPLGPVCHKGIEIYGVTHPGGWGNGYTKRIETEWSFLAARLKQLETQRQLA
jgi:hypothetical protein